MLQRIQSLYLLITSVLMVIMLSCPLGKFLGGDQEFILRAFGLIQSHAEPSEYVFSTIYMGILMAMAAALPFLTIFLYKNRILQIRLCFMELVFLAGLQVFVGYYLYHTVASFKSLGEMSYTLTPVDVLPLVGMIFVWLANRGIMRDEALVRSVNRIR